MIKTVQNKLIRLGLLLLISIFSICVYAQSGNTLSSFSRLGVGNVNYNNQASFNSMGGASIAITKPFQLNSSNPATYSFLLTPVFNIGGRGERQTAKNATNSETRTEAYFTNLGMGFNVGKNGGLAFGIQPTTNVGYNLSLASEDPVIGDLNYQTEGDGGLNDLYIGYAYLLKNTDSLKISVGANANYLFGHIDKSDKLYYPSGLGYVNTMYTESVVFNDFAFNFGLIIQKKFLNDFELSFGATYSYGNDVKVKADYFVGSFITDAQEVDYVRDTISLSEGEKKYFSKPHQLRGGFGIVFDKKLLLSFDASYGMWKNQTADKYVFKNKYKNDLGLRFGIEYTPDGKMKYKGNLFEAISYRVGVNYTNCYQIVNNNQLNEISGSFGLGVPIHRKTSGTRVNLGIQYGKRGDVEKTLIEEDFLNYYIGLSIVPTWKDKWFVKRKYN